MTMVNLIFFLIMTELTKFESVLKDFKLNFLKKIFKILIVK